MKPKRCGNCNFWDKDNARKFADSNFAIAQCKYPISTDKNGSIYENLGSLCRVYKERQDAK